MSRTEQRFWAKVDHSGGPDACWPWRSSVSPTGYGVFRFDGHNEYAHRIAHKFAIGPIPPKMEVDHVCHNRSDCLGGVECPHRRCVNPSHIEAVTHAENAKRGRTGFVAAARNLAKTRCPIGHPYDIKNTRIHDGHRHCRACVIVRQRKRRIRERESRAVAL
jgi:hypothetical protein